MFLGFHMGSCPPSDKPTVKDEAEENPKDDSDKESKDDREKETEDEATERPTTEASQTVTSTTSCSVTMTAVQQSVFCTVTASSGEHPAAASAECSTATYKTTTACETVYGSTYSSISTVSPAESQLCRPDSCGGGTCNVSGKELVKRAPIRLTQPQAGFWVEPENYGGNIDNFVAGGMYRKSCLQVDAAVPHSYKRNIHDNPEISMLY